MVPRPQLLRRLGGGREQIGFGAMAEGHNEVLIG